MEQNTLLQCVRHIVSKNFLRPDNDKKAIEEEGGKEMEDEEEEGKKEEEEDDEGDEEGEEFDERVSECASASNEQMTED